MRSTFLIILVLILLSLASLDVTSAPTVSIDDPQDGDVFTNRTVTVSGKANGSDASWFQGSRTAFNAGTRESVVVTSSGPVQDRHVQPRGRLLRQRAPPVLLRQREGVQDPHPPLRGPVQLRPDRPEI